MIKISKKHFNPALKILSVFIFIAVFGFSIFGFYGFQINKAQAAVTYQTPGAIAYSAANGTSVSPAYPISTTAGDLLVLIIGMKPSVANGGSVTTPIGWTPIVSLTGAGGYGATLGADTGNTNIFTFYKVAVGGESGSLAVTIATNNISWAQMYRFSAGAGSTWNVAGTTGSDITAGNVSIVHSANPGVTAGDYILGAMVIPTDVTTPAQFSSESLSQTGITSFTVTEISEPDSALGNQIGGVTYRALVGLGTGTALFAPTFGASAGGTTTNVRGPGVFIRVREINNPPAVILNTADAFNFGTDATPTVDFTGTDTEANDVEYNVQIDTVNTFNSQQSSVDVSTASYASKFFSVTSQEASPSDLAFSSDGTKMYVIGYTSDTVYQYTLTTAWDVSTANYTVPKSYSIATQELNPHGLAFSSDGTKMYIVGFSNATVYQYTLTIAWDVSTANYTVPKSYHETQNPWPEALAFNSNGTKMYIVGTANDTVYQYTLTTAWDVSTASYASLSYLETQEGQPYGLTFSSDGSKMYIVGITNDRVSQYNMSAPLLDKVSVADTGFINPDVADLHPFISGDNIQYTVQGADALASGTYYWRVRGKDPLASNTYGAWSGTRTFAVDVGGRLFSSGFELQSVATDVEWTTINGTPIINTTTKRSGSASLEISSLTSATQKRTNYQFKSANANGPFFGRTYIKISTAPFAENRIISFRDSGAVDRAYITLDNGRLLRLYDATGVIGSASSALTLDTWYRVELKIDASGAGATDIVEARIDGTNFATSGTRTLANGPNQFVIGGNLNGEAQTTGIWYFDDVAVNENVGFTQNSYPGAGSIVHLRPNAGGDTVGWTGTYLDIDEIIPNDTTDFINTTTAGYIEEANLFDSSTVGIGSSDTINVLQVGLRFASSSASVSEAAVRIKFASGGTLSESSNIATNGAVWFTNANAVPRNYPLSSYTKPGGGLWTPANIDTAQIGAKLIIDGGPNAYLITTMWLLVESVPAAVTPTVISPTFTSITSSGATLGANITSDGGIALTARGTCWGTTSAPTTNCFAEGGITTGIFTHTRTGMNPGTLIYYRGYATNSIGTGYSADGSFTTSLPAPTVSSVTGENPQTTLGGKSITINGTNFVSIPTVTIGGTAATGVIWNSSIQLTATAPAKAAGSYDVIVTNPDSQQSNTCVNCMSYIIPPTVTTVSPNNNLNLAGGQTVTVSGSNILIGANGAKVDTTIVTTFGTSSSATFTTPAHAVGSVTLRVYGTSGTDTNGIYTDYAPFTYTLPAPTVTPPVAGENPQTTLGGKSITINGTNFEVTPTVTIGGTPATGVVRNSSTQLTATAPAKAAGSYNVIVTNPDLQQSNTCVNCMSYYSLITGYLISSTFDTGHSGGVTFNSIMYKGNPGTGGTVRFQLASSNSPTGPWNYIGSDGSSSSSYVTTGSNAPVTIIGAHHNNKRYYRYKIYLDFKDIIGLTRPVVNGVIVNWSP